MDHRIIRFNAACEDGTEVWKGMPLDTVKDHAKEIIRLQLAERVEVRDAEGVLVFHWPRLMRVAPRN